MDKKLTIIAALLLLSFGVVMRLVPHLPNFTPVAAIAIVGSRYLKKSWGVALPIGIVFISDLAIGFYDWRIMLSVYFSFALIGMLGWVAARYRTLFASGVAAVSASVSFFLITNAAVWLFSPWYAKTLSGLLYSYELGVPFFRNMLVGDISYTIMLVCAVETVLILAVNRRFEQFFRWQW